MKTRLLAVLIILFGPMPISVHLAAADCYTITQPHSLPAAEYWDWLIRKDSDVEFAMTRLKFHVRDRQNPKFQFKAVVDKEDESLHLLVETRYRGSISKYLNATKLFEIMMKNFSDMDVRISRISAYWVDGTNYGTFFQMKAAGASDEAAAFATWTGTQARNYGFHKVNVSVSGSGDDTRVVSIFSK